MTARAVGRASGQVSPNPSTRRQRILARVIYAALIADWWTQRRQVKDPHGSLAFAHEQPAIFALWHNRLAFSLLIHRHIVQSGPGGRRLAALVSASRDGALLAAILEAFNVHPVRGSTSRRGPQALLELTTCAEAGFHLAITPDGPRGPCYKVQPGIVSLARVTRRPIIPVTGGASWNLRLRSWDRFQIPLPFGSYEIHFGPRFLVEADDDANLESTRAEIEQWMVRETRD